MTIYTATTAEQATHTVEIFRGQQPTAEGEDFSLFVGGDVQVADAVLTWMEDQGVVQEDPDMYALVVPAGEGRDNQPLAILHIAPAAEPTAELVSEQTAARRPGRPSIAEDGETTRIPVTLPVTVVQRLNTVATRTGAKSRSDVMRRYIIAGLEQDEAAEPYVATLPFVPLQAAPPRRVWMVVSPDQATHVMQVPFSGTAKDRAEVAENFLADAEIRGDQNAIDAFWEGIDEDEMVVTVVPVERAGEGNPGGLYLAPTDEVVTATTRLDRAGLVEAVAYYAADRQQWGGTAESPLAASIMAAAKARGASLEALRFAADVACGYQKASAAEVLAVLRGAGTAR